MSDDELLGVYSQTFIEIIDVEEDDE